MNGFIKLYRKLLDWEWYSDTNCWRVFSHCLIMANWQDKSWRGKIIERGSFVTSLNKLSQQTGLTKQQTRTALNKLQSTGEITQQATQRYTYITICNYDTYQGFDIVDQHSQQHATNTQSNTQITHGATTTKEVKNKRSKNKYNARFDEFWDAYALKKDRKKCEKKFNSLKESEQLKAIEHSKEYREHHYRYGKIEYLPNPMTYLNNERWNDEQLPYEHLDEAVLPKKRTKEDEMAELRRMMG